MSLEDKIRENVKESLRHRDKARVSILRLVLSEIKNAEIAQHQPLNDDQILGVIGREVKRHRESIELFRKGNRNDLVAQEEVELNILMEYLPRQMSRQEIMTAAKQVIAEVGAKEIGDKGKVMSQLMPQLRGKADGKEVSEVVLELLSAA
jgi:hypothetical protein